MKNLSKILVVVILLTTLLTCIAGLNLNASAATPTTLYLTPNSNWKQSNARFAAYFMNSSKTTTKWVDMSDPDGDGTYEVTVPQGT